MSQEQKQVIKTLMDFGLTQTDAEIYVFLAKKGAQRGLDIRKALKLSKEQLYSSLRNMKSKGIISSTIEYPARFSTLPFEKVLDLFIKAKMEETQRLQQSKEEILSNWQSLKIAENDTSAKFTVVEGRNYIYSRIQQMIQETKNRILTITTVPGLIQADQRGIFDAGFNHGLKAKIQFRFLAELTKQNVNAVKALLKEAGSAKLNVEGRNTDLGLSMFPQMVIRDEDEALFFIKPRTETSIIEQDDVCLWTDSKTLVQAFTAVFEELWRNATDIEKKIAEIETGKPPAKTCIIADAKAAEKKYDEMLHLAKDEIIMVTSSQGIIEYGKQMPLLERLAESGISVKIMAPIMQENFDAAKRISKFCEVRHVPTDYLGTTIIDGKHLFQFKTRSPDQKHESAPHFENTFYTSDLEYVEKTKNTLNDIWQNARAPSSVTLDSIFGPRGPSLGPPPENDFLPTKKKMGAITVIDVKPSGTVTEKDVLNKFMSAQKIPRKNPESDVSVIYASMAWAAIHPPEYFNLPDIMIQATHIDKQSSFGGTADYVIVFLWLETPKGHAYVPVAFAIDNPHSKDFVSMLLSGSHAAQNVQALNKDEIQICVHGNTLFAGWTVPIPLHPKPYILPPACLLVEGYGEVKTAAYGLLNPLGVKSELEQNYFDAFVTFFHPSSKYSGPGTDGKFIRDFIMTVTPPPKSER